MKRAIFDIGSNSVRLMLLADGKTLYKTVVTTRLGEGLSGSGKISDEAASRTLSALSALAVEARGEGAVCRAFATAAVRNAKNGREFAARVQKECGMETEIVSGEEEALLGLNGALGTRDGGIIDIGGASTEVCIREGGNVVFSVSLPLGCVSLYDECGTDEGRLTRKITEKLTSLPRIGLPLYALGGTASTLASIRLGLSRYDGGLLQDCELPRVWVGETAKTLLALPYEARLRIKGMDPRRADILGGGALLLSLLMGQVGAERVLFSDRDNLEGYAVLRGLI